MLAFVTAATGLLIGHWTGHLNMVNLNGDLWGTFYGAVGTTQGARLGAVYTGGDGAVITLGKVNDICFNEPSSCDSGFTVSLWFKHRTTYSNDVTVRQIFVTIGDKARFPFKLFQTGRRTDEHLAVKVSASSKQCFYIFPVPRSLWSLFVFVWNTTDLNIFRNGLKVERLKGFCKDEKQKAIEQPVVTLNGDAMFDDLKIWNRTLEPNEINDMFTCLRDERGDQDFEISLQVKLLDEEWNPNMADTSHYQFNQLKNNIESQIWDVYVDVEKTHYIETIVTHKFRPGSVIADFSIIFNLPYYEMIMPLLEAINQNS
ncbi:hypothetical protein OS493_034173 [Desmophyllum pertusum]|uniref:SEA domain-containing protein n=1 Tax=Desmophyllum pertusum TaxID=174260 RepID=A0A9X0D811_9CNID|nr:hypothetical protein OS493_034173 [Desmophyllum pertusum]